MPEQVRSRALHPLRTLVVLMGGALVALVAIVSSAATGRAPDPSLLRRLLAVQSDTDSVAVDLTALDSTRRDATLARLDAALIDSLLADTTLADSLALPDTGLAPRYLPSWHRDRWTASPLQRRTRPLSPRIGAYWKHEVVLDSTEQAYIARERIGEADVRYPLRMDLQTYRDTRLDYDLDLSWRELVDQRALQRANQSRGGLGFNIVVPGGQQSAFTTIFGKPEVDLRVNGQADIRAGFDYRKSDQQVAYTGRVSQLDPDFKQDLRLGITGRIGDKLSVDVNWDTNNQFDYQNQLKLHYQGYEDEIIQNIEAGNVFLNTPSRLIRGGQSLFGIKSEMQMGGLTLTTVASQQEGQANSLSIEGGSETTEFDLRPTDYDDNTHFFLGYYFRNRWEDALSQPPNVILYDGFNGITDIEVWKLQQVAPEEQNVRQVVAVVDLGEPANLLEEANAFTNPVLPDNLVDQYPDDYVAAMMRSGDATPSTHLTGAAPQVNLSDADFQVGRFRKLERGRDYDIDDALGYLSLRQRLQDSEALAVSFRYVANGQTKTVGDFSTETGGSAGGQNEDRLVLKLLRPVQLRQPAPEQGFNPAAWYLELRNIYRLQGRGLNPTDFDLQIYFEPPGKTPSKTIAEVTGQRTLLQVLGLDRLNTDRALSPDDRFDYLPNYTIDPGNGELIFPYLEPFGSHLEELIEQSTASPGDKEARKNLYVFKSLYRQKKENARRDTQLDVYRVRGSYKGGVQEFYDLRAYAGLVPGSVRVTSGGSVLTEGIDYVVDYQGGTVTVTNPAHLASGRDINITYEQNSFFNLQKKTLLGVRADYNLSERLDMGATVMRLNQKSPIDKFRIGEEPISNTIWGLDGALNLEPRWLTRFVDALPFIQTKAPSSIQVTGEFAQLRPGASETIAFERTRRLLRENGRDFKGDELRGISYLDDFEGFETTLSLKQPGAWRISSAPDSLGRYPLSTSAFDSLRTTLRGTFAWYQLNVNIIKDLCPEVPGCDLNKPLPAAYGPVYIEEVYPNRDTRGEPDPTLPTFDLYFHPQERGPYNYTTDLRGFIDNPKDNWGGIMQRLPEGYTDFGLKNIEFVEFVFQPFAENAQNDAGRDARLYVDLGSVSEDVIPDLQLNNEDGLSLTTINGSSIRKWGRSPTVTQNNIVDVDEEARRTEDLGLDGLASYDTDRYGPATEQTHFTDFLNALDPSESDPRYRAEAAKAQADPSGDDYYYFQDRGFFNNPAFFPNGASFQQRFSRWFPGQELNSFEGQNKLAPSDRTKRGNSRIPDSEDLNINSTVDTDNAYFQYELPLSRTALDSLAVPGRDDDYVVTEITDDQGNGTGWYQVRIPIRDWTRKVGQIQDFSLIENIRIWTTGHEVPATLRFATLELVGSQWQKSEQITLERETPSDTLATETRFSISSVNNEENPNIYKTPNGTIISQTRLASGQTQFAREQAMVLRAENLMPGKQRAIYKTQTQALDLLRYENLRMFLHMHGKLADGQALENMPLDEARGKVTFFLRLGANETNDYYEYELPLTPSDPNSGDADVLWQTNQTYGGRTIDLNSVNLVLGALNQLKVARERAAFRTDSVYWSDIHNVALNPSIEDFAPPGTRIGVKGNPSLGRVNTIVMGIRNAADSTTVGAMKNRAADDILQDVTVWVNEMRVTGYDETNGRAALANADIKLADLAAIKASFSWQEDGFGSLSSTLAEREQNSLLNWSVTTDFNLDKFIPERFGWSIPISVQVQANTTTPRFAPQQDDIRLDQFLAQIEENDELTPEEREIQKQEAFEAAQTSTVTRSFTTRLQKSGSRSRLLRNTVDGLSFNYSWSDNDGSSPTQQMNDSWRWASTVGYRLNIRRPRTVRPFWFLDSVPVVGVLGDLQFNYLPQSLSFNGSANRNFSETQDRPRALRDTSMVPEEVRFPIRGQHALAHRRTFALQYNPFAFLNLSYDTNTNQSLNALGVDTLFTVVTLDTTGNARFFPNVTLDDSTAYVHPGLADAYQVERLDVKSAEEVFNRLFSNQYGDLLRTDRYEQRFSASFRPNFAQMEALNWINLQDVVYGVNYGWQNGSVGRNTGANVNNQIELRGGLTLRPQEFWRKFGFYKTLEEQQRAAEAEAAAAQREREEQRRRRQEERRRLREERRQGNTADEIPEDEIPEDEVPEDEIPEDEVPGVQPVPAAPDPTTVDTTAVEEKKGGLKLPLPNPGALLRRTVLALTGIRDFSVTYNGTFGSTSSNVGRPIFDDAGQLRDVDVSYSLLNALKGHGPSPAYRFGFDRQIDLYGPGGNFSRVLDPTLQVTDVLQDAHRLQARTTLSPSQSFQINLTWNTDWNENESYTYRPLFDEQDILVGVDTTLTANGNSRSSVWAFGADYLKLFQRQLDAYNADFAQADQPAQGIGDENGDGRVALTNRSIVEDFRQSFLSGLGTFDSRGLLPIPMPGWQVSYSGLSKWPLINRLVQTATLRHGYTSDYSTDFRQNPLAADSTREFTLGSQRILFAVPRYEVGGIRINERYQPLVGLDLTWKGRLQTNVAWNKSNAYALSTSNNEVSENKTSELTFTGSWQQQGLTLPFLKNRLNNRISFSLTVSYATLSDKRYSLVRAMKDAITRSDFVLDDALTGDNITPVTASNRLTVSPQISYQFSNRVQANFLVKYENFQSEDSRTPSATTVNGGFNVRVSIAN